MCDFFGISRAAYYGWRKRCAEPDRDAVQMQLVAEAYQASHRTYGYRRIQIWIEQHKDITINHKAVLRLMNKMGIRSVARQRRPLYLAAQALTQHTYPNLLQRDFTADRPNQKWVTDITYIPTKQGWAYLATIKDLHDGFIVAHRLGRRNSVDLVRQMLKEACEKEKVTAGTLIHSDQGHQYGSHAYAVLITAYDLIASMSRRGNCWDNAVMENFFGHLKEEFLRHYPPQSFEEVRLLIDEYVNFYNYERIQLKSKQTPYQLRCLFA
jgi:transposase InsO family protein